MRKLFKKVVKTFISRQRISSIAGQGAVLAYHRIVPDPLFFTDFSPNIYITTGLSEFRGQIEYLSKNYKVLSINQFYEGYIAKKLPPKVAVITFDDGYYDNVELALPVLEEFGVPATIFATVGFITEQNQPWWFLLEELVGNTERLAFSWQGQNYSWEYTNNKIRIESMYKIKELFLTSNKEQFLNLYHLLFNDIAKVELSKKLFMNETELKQIAKHPLITIGAHTLIHPALSHFSEKDLREELEKSKSWLEVTIGKPVDFLAYPYGGLECASNREFLAAKDAGFKAAFTTQTDQVNYGHDLHGFPRVCIDCYDNYVNFLWKINGYYALREKRGL